MSESTKPAEPVDDVTELSQPEEVAARSADQVKPSLKHRKVFVIAGIKHVDEPPHVGEDADEANKAAVRQGAINAGLWPTADVKRVGKPVRHDDGISWVLTYEVPTQPAHDVPVDVAGPEVIADDTDDGGASKARNAKA